MSFFLFSRAQKRDSNSSRKFFNLNNKIIINDFKNNVNKKKTILYKDNIKNKKFILYKLNKIDKFKNNKDNYNLLLKKNNNKMNLELLKIKHININSVNNKII